MSNEILIRCCAPTMACLKTGNMFSCDFETHGQMIDELRRLNQRLGQKGLRILPLRWRDGKALLYLYRPRMLERDLRDPLAGKLLSECGLHQRGIPHLRNAYDRTRASRSLVHRLDQADRYLPAVPPFDVGPLPLGSRRRRPLTGICPEFDIIRDI